MILITTEYALNAVNQGVTALGIKGTSYDDHGHSRRFDELREKFLEI
jgi:hypothetical protein